MPRNPKRHLKAPETTLYAPVKRYLERLGFTVKGEVCGCDLVALRGEEPPIVVIGELKLAFSLELVRAACVIRVCISFAASWASACWGCRPSGRSKCLLSRDPGVPARTPSAALGWFKNIAAG